MYIMTYFLAVYPDILLGRIFDGGEFLQLNVVLKKVLCFVYSLPDLTNKDELSVQPLG